MNINFESNIDETMACLTINRLMPAHHDYQQVQKQALAQQYVNLSRLKNSKSLV